MASRYCTYCGTSNPATAAFCMSCGAPMQGAPSAPPGAGPLPVSGAPGTTPAPVGPYPAAGGYAPPPPPPPRKRHRWLLIIAVVIVAVLLIGGLALFLLPSPNVQVTVINYVSPDNSCGWQGFQDYGFNVTPGTSYPIEYTNVTGNETANGTAACEIHSVTTTTSGFSISNASVPLIIPANTGEIFQFTINTPSSSYTGPLTIVIT